MVVNCSQIFCTFAVETTVKHLSIDVYLLWIALKFFVLLQSKQPWELNSWWPLRCELLSNFLYFCSRNNGTIGHDCYSFVVNCSQIFCTFAVETTEWTLYWTCGRCELLSNFLYFCSRNNSWLFLLFSIRVVNCSQIFCTFAVETTQHCCLRIEPGLWIALKFFVLLQSKQLEVFHPLHRCVVNCSQIFCTFAVETTNSNGWTLQTLLWIALKFFVLLQSKQLSCWNIFFEVVVNCSQIFCTFAVETTREGEFNVRIRLWIALKFFVLLQSKQLASTFCLPWPSCELLSNFLYFCSRNN